MLDERVEDSRGCDGDDGDDNNRHGIGSFGADLAIGRIQITSDRLQAGKAAGVAGLGGVYVHSQPATGALSGGGGGRATSNVSGKLGETVGKRVDPSRSVESQPGTSVK